MTTAMIRRSLMMLNYGGASLLKACCRFLPAGEGYFGSIDELQGVWPNANSLKACHEELQEVLEKWISLD
jgi:hypothetical protein